MRYALAWALFWVGDKISYALGWFPGEVPHGLGWLLTTLYRIYNWFMLLSDRAQGDGPGPWSHETTND